MLENMDHHVGRLVEYLKSIGEYENTIFIVFGDNGAEGTDLFEMVAGTPGTLNYLWAAMKWSNNDPKAWGEPGSFVGYGPMWAQVSMTPFSQYKGWLAEGGIRNALIVSGPVVQRPAGSIHRAVMHISDIMPTLLEVAGSQYPASHRGKNLPMIKGKSWVPILKGETDVIRAPEDYLAWEIFGNRALRQGHWKIRWQWKPFGTGDWELYDLSADPGERHNLAELNTEKLVAMLDLWNEYMAENNVILPSRSPFESLEDQLPTRVPDDPGFPPLVNKRQFIPPPEMVKEPSQ
jgi:arylsulfatase